MKKISAAWVEDDGLTKKLGVRFGEGGAAETFGLFFQHHRIVAEEFVGLNENEANVKFNAVVYSKL